MAIALTRLRVWDGRAERATPPGWTLRIDQGRIVALGPQPGLVEGAQAIPLDGATAIPGLCDAHVHLTLDPAIRSPADQFRVPPNQLERALVERASAMVRAGVTTARDLGGGEGFEIRLRDRIGRGEVPGPRLLCAGQPLTSVGGHGHFWGGEVRDPEEISELVRRQVDRGADWIKVMATGGVMTRGTSLRDAQFDVPALRRVVSESAARGRAVAAHCHGTEGIRNAASAGVRTIEHCSFAGTGGFGSNLSRAVVRQLAEGSAAPEPERLWVSPTVNANWARLSRKEGAPTAFGMRMARVLRALRDAGVRFVASTDAGIPGVEHHRLPEALAVFAWMAGLAPVDALRAATSGAAEALGVADETGRLAPGLAADVLVVNGDPLRDLSALERPRLVVARGRIAFATAERPSAGVAAGPGLA
jgi:imidazolonepropionase-like amidohydrolase